VAKLNSSGSALIYSTYLGGSNFDVSNGLAIDSNDNVFVTGRTDSSNFPTTPETFQDFSNFEADGYVTKLISIATGLIYSTYLGGNNGDQGLAITTDSSGSAYVTGMTSSTNFPTTPGAFQTLLGGAPNNFSADAFVAKLNQMPGLRADLGLSLTGPTGPITPGLSVSYGITVTNDGLDPAFGVVITDELSPALDFSFCSSSSFSWSSSQ
jgi:uncharacterized repeat protein (TIGR01451 family)